MKAAPGEKAGASRSTTVEKGDTLWTVRRSNLGSPWYWPKVWSYKPGDREPPLDLPGQRGAVLLDPAKNSDAGRAGHRARGQPGRAAR